MTIQSPTTVDEYIALQPSAAQGMLMQVRTAILSAVPDAVESISYKMPTYKLSGERLLYFAGWKNHYSLYPATGHLVEALKDELAPYEVDNGTIRFPLNAPVPEELIAKIAKMRAQDIRERISK